MNGYGMQRRTGARNVGGESGFSLAEMLIVLAILAILSAIAVPAYLGHRTKAIRTEAIANLESLRLLEEQFFSENGCYYISAGSCTNATISGVSNLQGFLPGFRPGNVNSLKFSYSITTTGTAGSFTAQAVGKAGTPVAGTTLSVDEDNNKSGF